MSKENAQRAEDCPPCDCEDTMTGNAAEDAKAFTERNPPAAAVIRGEGAKAERTRIAQIHQLAEPGEDKLTAKFVDDGTDVGAAALGYAAERKAAKAAAAAARSTDTPAPLNQQPAGDQTQQPKKEEKSAADMTDDELKAHYNSDKALKAEFGTAEVYIGYVRGSAKGQIRQLKK